VCAVATRGVLVSWEGAWVFPHIYPSPFLIGVSMHMQVNIRKGGTKNSRFINNLSQTLLVGEKLEPRRQGAQEPS